MSEASRQGEADRGEAGMVRQAGRQAGREGEVGRVSETG